MRKGAVFMLGGSISVPCSGEIHANDYGTFPVTEGSVACAEKCMFSGKPPGLFNG